ncbi:hypothetical protein SADUNF_Sadunf04G0139100 [Salix dunnii]|uniref:Retrotransposon Copia-like N-terminal domain-containing protein n=1 Tax=Salix dunnii TaxID=1413687 RepID=A0A835N159_9ROSI|nr:hypothetical protein SADUNF_Sadunf04G0139100 [Salix dunnii]
METENLQTLQQTPPSTVQSTSRFHNLSDQNNPYRLDNSDTSVLSLVTDPLTTENYVTWARAMRRVLRAKNKLGFVDGSITKPSDPNDPLREAWERCNDMIVSWIHNSVSSSVKSSFVLVDNACEIWNELCERLTQQNGPRIFQLKGALANLTQGNDLVNVYYGKLKSIWDELSLHCPMPECSCGQMKILIDRYQQDCVIQFLMGLNETYSNVRDQIMLMDPIPQVSKVFSLVQQQEKQHQMLLSTSAPDSMVLFTRNVSTPFKPFSKTYCSYCKIQGHSIEDCFKLGNSKPPICSHCNLSGHLAEKCYKLVGYPPGHKLYNRGKRPGVHTRQTNMVVAEDFPKNHVDKMDLISNQYQNILKLLHEKHSPVPNMPMANTTSLPSMSVEGAELFSQSSHPILSSFLFRSF